MALAKQKKPKTRSQTPQRTDPGIGNPVIFQCKKCKIPVSKAVRLLVHFPDPKAMKYEEPRVAAGYYFLQGGDYVLNLADLRDTLSIPDMGCCGQSGMRGMNVTCANGHEIATELSDCCTTRDVTLNPNRVSPVTKYQ